MIILRSDILKFITNEKVYLPLLYLLVGFIIYQIIAYFIGKLVKNSHTNKRKKTIISLIKNITKYLLIIVLGLETLKIYGINTNSILASLGIASVVIGLAFKDIMTDFLSGMFILFDNQYTIGDVVCINGFTGEVISLGLRTTRIKAFTGEVKIISNSSFKEVTNYNIKNNTVYMKLPVDYGTSLEKLEKVLKGLEEHVLGIEGVSGGYKLLGIDEFGDSAIIYMISVDVKPSYAYSVKRKINRLVKDSFDKEGIVIPYNKLDVNIESRES